MMVTHHTSMAEMCRWLMPDTAAFLDEESYEVQTMTLMGLRNWMCQRETDLEAVDLVELSDRIDFFVRSFVRAYKGEPDD